MENSLGIVYTVYEYFKRNNNNIAKKIKKEYKINDCSIKISQTLENIMQEFNQRNQANDVSMIKKSEEYIIQKKKRKFSDGINDDAPKLKLKKNERIVINENNKKSATSSDSSTSSEDDNINIKKAKLDGKEIKPVITELGIKNKLTKSSSNKINNKINDSTHISKTINLKSVNSSIVLKDTSSNDNSSSSDEEVEGSLVSTNIEKLIETTNSKNTISLNTKNQELSKQKSSSSSDSSLEDVVKTVALPIVDKKNKGKKEIKAKKNLEISKSKSSSSSNSSSDEEVAKTVIEPIVGKKKKVKKVKTGIKIDTNQVTDKSNLNNKTNGTTSGHRPNSNDEKNIVKNEKSVKKLNIEPLILPTNKDTSGSESSSEDETRPGLGSQMLVQQNNHQKIVIENTVKSMKDNIKAKESSESDSDSSDEENIQNKTKECDKTNLNIIAKNVPIKTMSKPEQNASIDAEKSSSSDSSDDENVAKTFKLAVITKTIKQVDKIPAKNGEKIVDKKVKKINKEAVDISKSKSEDSSNSSSDESIKPTIIKEEAKNTTKSDKSMPLISAYKADSKVKIIAENINETSSSESSDYESDHATITNQIQPINSIPIIAVTKPVTSSSSDSEIEDKIKKPEPVIPVNKLEKSKKNKNKFMAKDLVTKLETKKVINSNNISINAKISKKVNKVKADSQNVNIMPQKKADLSSDSSSDDDVPHPILAVKSKGKKVTTGIGKIPNSLANSFKNDETEVSNISIEKSSAKKSVSKKVQNACENIAKTIKEIDNKDILDTKLSSVESSKNLIDDKAKKVTKKAMKEAKKQQNSCSSENSKENTIKNPVAVDAPVDCKLPVVIHKVNVAQKQTTDVKVKVEEKEDSSSVSSISSDENGKKSDKKITVSKKSKAYQVNYIENDKTANTESNISKEVTTIKQADKSSSDSSSSSEEEILKTPMNSSANDKSQKNTPLTVTPKASIVATIVKKDSSSSDDSSSDDDNEVKTPALAQLEIKKEAVFVNKNVVAKKDSSSSEESSDDEEDVKIKLDKKADEFVKPIANDSNNKNNSIEKKGINMPFRRVKKEKSTDCDSALIPLLCVHG